MLDIGNLDTVLTTFGVERNGVVIVVKGYTNIDRGFYAEYPTRNEWEIIGYLMEDRKMLMMAKYIWVVASF